MKTIMLDNYASFQCLAGACTSTCCAGWSIRIDKKDYERFEKMEPDWLREEVLKNVQIRGHQYYFKNHKDGRCTMLDEDGLCRIQRNTSEETLCNTCRKYPRLINSVDGVLYLSMAVSCPVVSEYLIEKGLGWQIMDDSRTSRRILSCDVELAKDAWEFYQKNLQAANQLQKEMGNESVLYGCFEKMAAGILDIVLEYRNTPFSIETFQAMEEDNSAKLVCFLKKNENLWERLVKNYMQYRILSRRMEFPEEKSSICVKQVQGELLLLRILLFCRYVKEDSIKKQDYAELLQMVYRFSAHGKNVAEAFQALIRDFFAQDVLWSYVLL